MLNSISFNPKKLALEYIQLPYIFNKNKDRDILLKNISNLKFKALMLIIDKLMIAIHVQKIEKIYDYFILQSICLIDTISSQKPKIKALKCKYTFGSKAFSFSCKVTLRKRKLKYFMLLFNFVILSEMKRRHIYITSLFDLLVKRDYFSFSFSIKNTNVFFKLDEFYFKWNYPITFTFVIF